MKMWKIKILLICIVGFINVGLCEQFSEIILGEYLKDPNISQINSLVEEVEVTLDVDKLKELERTLQEEIEKKTEPEFLYYYFLARTYYAFANFYEEKQDKKKIRKFLEKVLPLCKSAIRLNREFSDAHRLLGDTYGRLINFKNPIIYGMLYGPRATKAIELAIKLNPQNPEAYLARGRGYFYTPVGFGGSKKKALEMYKKAVEVCPNYYMNYMWIGLWYLDRREKEKAKESFKKVLELKPGFGWAIYKLKKLEQDD